MISEISVQSLKNKLANKDNDKFQFIDCRELAEWNEAHIAGATLLPLSEFEAKYQETLPNKEEEIVIQCRSGKRSMNACMFLLHQGYKNLVNVEGGILAWIEEGNEVISE